MSSAVWNHRLCKQRKLCLGWPQKRPLSRKLMAVASKVAVWWLSSRVADSDSSFSYERQRSCCSFLVSTERKGSLRIFDDCPGSGSLLDSARMEAFWIVLQQWLSDYYLAPVEIRILSQETLVRFSMAMCSSHRPDFYDDGRLADVGSMVQKAI